MGIPVVAFAHSDLSRLLAHRCGRAAAALADVYLRRLYARFDAVWAPSRVIARRLERAGVARVAVQPLGVDPRIFHPGRRDPALRAELGLPASTRLLIFAGRLAAEKRIPLLRDAVQQLGAPYHLLLVGGDTARRLDARTTRLPYQQNGAALARLLASADMLVHAGAHETFGIVILEAMACGRPVVGVAAGAIPELVDARVGALATPGDAAAIAAAIDDVYARDPDALGAIARARVEHDYAWTRTFDRQLDAYALLLPRTLATATAALAEAG
jgi:alpha-1,6-mannosyltransferase